MSKFTSFEAKKLFKLYKHAAKKREETKAQEVCLNISLLLFFNFVFQGHALVSLKVVEQDAFQ